MRKQSIQVRCFARQGLHIAVRAQHYGERTLRS